MSTQKKTWGFTSDSDKALESKNDGVFGLNTNVLVTRFEYNPNGGKNNVPTDCLDINIQVGDKTFMLRIFESTRFWYGGKEVFKGDENYDKAVESSMIQTEARVIHFLKAFGITEGQIQGALQTGNVVDFRSWLTTLISLVPANYQSMPVDLFLQWQKKMPEGRDRTYLEVPVSLSIGGKFIFPAVKPVGTWVAVEKDGGLIYVDGAGNEHPCFRTQSFMQSVYATQQIESNQLANNVNPMNAIPQAGTIASGTTPKTSTWD